jgi:hypothetical protein
VDEVLAALRDDSLGYARESVLLRDPLSCRLIENFHSFRLTRNRAVFVGTNHSLLYAEELSHDGEKQKLRC